MPKGPRREKRLRDVIGNPAHVMRIAGSPLAVEPMGDIPVLDLDELVSRITDENRHEEVPTGRARGYEFYRE